VSAYIIVYTHSASFLPLRGLSGMHGFRISRGGKPFELVLLLFLQPSFRCDVATARGDVICNPPTGGAHDTFA
jgi:hypothetical protein